MWVSQFGNETGCSLLTNSLKAEELLQLRTENERLKQRLGVTEYRVRVQSEELTARRTQAAELTAAVSRLETRVRHVEADKILLELNAATEAEARKAIVAEGEVNNAVLAATIKIAPLQRLVSSIRKDQAWLAGERRRVVALAQELTTERARYLAGHLDNFDEFRAQAARLDSTVSGKNALQLQSNLLLRW